MDGRMAERRRHSLLIRGKVGSALWMDAWREGHGRWETDDGWIK